MSLINQHLLSKANRRKQLEVGFEADLFSTTLPGLESFVKADYLKMSNHQILILKNMKLITALRVILTMVREEDKDLSWLDVFAIFEILLRIETSVIGNPGFVNKFGSHLKVVNEILLTLNWKPKKSESALKILRAGLKVLPEKFFFSPRNLNQVKLEYRKKVILVIRRPEGTQLKYLPPKLYVGKGYTDKGTARKPHLDGSPRWQDVAMSEILNDTRSKDLKEMLE